MFGFNKTYPERNLDDKPFQFVPQTTHVGRDSKNFSLNQSFIMGTFVEPLFNVNRKKLIINHIAKIDRQCEDSRSSNPIRIGNHVNCDFQNNDSIILVSNESIGNHLTR